MDYLLRKLVERIYFLCGGMAGAPVQVEQFQGRQAAESLIFWQADARLDLWTFDQVKFKAACGIFAQGGFVD